MAVVRPAGWPAVVARTLLRWSHRLLLRVLRWVLLGLLGVLIGDVIAVTAFGPTLLLGAPWAAGWGVGLGATVGIPVAVVLFVLEGYLLRTILDARLSPQERREVQERRWVRRHARQQAWVDWLEGMNGGGQTYRDAIPTIGMIALLASPLVAQITLSIAVDIWPSIRQSWMTLAGCIVGIMHLCPVLAVLYAVHLRGLPSALVSWPVLAYLRRSMAARVAAGRVPPDLPERRVRPRAGSAVEGHRWPSPSWDDGGGGDFID
jgi:hypothetical protein